MIAITNNKVPRTTVAMLFVVPFTFLSASYVQGVARDDRQAEGFREIAVVGPEYLDAMRLKTLYEEGAGDASHVFTIDAVGDASYGPFMLGGHGPTDQGFQAWESNYRNYRVASDPAGLRMMRLTAIGRDVVIETVDRSQVSRTVLKGHDPMLFEAGGRKCQILEIYWSRPQMSLSKDGSVPLNVSIDLRTDILPAVAEAQIITSELQRRLNYAHITVDMRTDAWFIDDMRFPLWFPFSLDQKPPTFQEYVSRGRMGCSVRGSEILCVHSVR